MKNKSLHITKEEFNGFFDKYDKKELAGHVDKLISKMEKKIAFEIKMLNASIHFLKDNNIFSACGFRRRQKYFLVEFFSKTKINSKRVVMEIKNKYTENNNYIINRVEISDENEIDNELIEWICGSYGLI